MSESTAKLLTFTSSIMNANILANHLHILIQLSLNFKIRGQHHLCFLFEKKNLNLRWLVFQNESYSVMLSLVKTFKKLWVKTETSVWFAEQIKPIQLRCLQWPKWYCYDRNAKLILKYLYWHFVLYMTTIEANDCQLTFSLVCHTCLTHQVTLSNFTRHSHKTLCA